MSDLNSPIICRACGEELTEDGDVWVTNGPGGTSSLCSATKRTTVHTPTYRGVVVGYNERAVAQAIANLNERSDW